MDTENAPVRTSGYQTRSKAKLNSMTGQASTRRALGDISNNVATKKAGGKKSNATRHGIQTRGNSKRLAERAKGKAATKDPTRRSSRGKAQAKRKSAPMNHAAQPRKRSKNSMDIEEEDFTVSSVDEFDPNRMSITPDIKEEDVDMEEDVTAVVQMLDRCDLDDTFTMAEYAQDIYEQDRVEEKANQPNPQYMARQQDITPRMREKLMDWMIEVHNKFNLEPETLYLSKNVLDRFLDQKHVTKSKLQLVGCVALLLASKYEEIYPPVGQDFVYISANAFSKEQLFNMETVVLNQLKFDLTAPSALHFSRRFLKICGVKKEQSTIIHHVSYLLESTLQCYAFLNFPPSMIAVCATYIALRTAHILYGFAAENRTPEQTLLLLCQYTAYSKDDLLPCLTEYRQLLLTKLRYGAVRRKFQAEKWDAVVKLDVSGVFDALVNMDPADLPVQDAE